MGDENVISDYIWFFAMCIYFSVEKKKPKKEVALVSTAILRTKQNKGFILSPIMQYDHLFMEDDPFQKECWDAKGGKRTVPKCKVG